MLSTEERFWAKVDRRGPDECWPWRGGGNAGGYGHFSIGAATVGAHRFAYELANGPVPDGFYVCHSCDTPPCCNEKHLFAGTPADNAKDRDRKGHFANQGHGPNVKLSDESVLEVRRRVASGETQTAVARDFGLTQPYVSMLVNRTRRAAV